MKNTQNQFKLIQLLSLQKGLWLIAWLLGVATVLSVLGLVMVAGWFISMAAVAGVVAVGAHTLNYLMPSAVIRLFAITRTAARYGDLMVSHHAVFGLLKQLRVQFFAKWAKLPFLARTSDQSSSQKMQRLVKDIDTLDEFVLRVVSPWVMAMMSVMVLACMLLWFVPNGVLVVAVMVTTLVVALVVLKLGVAIARHEGVLLEQRKSQLVDTLPALTQLLIWQQWQNQVANLAHLDETHYQLMQKTHRLRRMGGLIIQMLVAVSVITLLVVVAEFFDTNSLPVFDAQNINHYPMLNPAIALALVLGLFGLIEIVMVLVSEPLALGRSMCAKDRLNELINDEHHTNPSVSLGSLVGQPLVLRLQDVSVKMPKAMITACRLSTVFDSKQPVLIVGASGAGKSTLLATLAGEIMPISGKITLNDVDYGAIDNEQFLGFLGQTVDIFDQTLADNLRLGKINANDDELLDVLKKVGLYEWAISQPKGLNTPLGEYGMAVSGGQARRIALARLLLSPKAILLLDEPFAGLDNTTRQTVWQSLTAMQQKGEIGILVIATHQVWGELYDARQVVIG